MLEVSRRALVGAGAAATGVVLLDDSVASARARADRDAPGGPVRSHYAAAVGQVFSLVGPRGAVRARLRRVGDVPAAAGADRELCFTLVFSPLASRPVGDAIWSVRRRSMPSHDLFLSALGREGDVQAVIDRRAA